MNPIPEYPPRLKTRDQRIAWMNRIMYYTRNYQQKDKTFDCPYRSYWYDENNGTIETKQHECSVGPDPTNKEWCKYLCPHYAKYKTSLQENTKKLYKDKKIKRLESYKKTGLAPWTRRKPNPNRIFNIIDDGMISNAREERLQELKKTENSFIKEEL